MSIVQSNNEYDVVLEFDGVATEEQISTISDYMYEEYQLDFFDIDDSLMPIIDSQGVSVHGYKCAEAARKHQYEIINYLKKLGLEMCNV